MLPVLVGCAEEELLLVVGGEDQFPKRDFTAVWAAGCAVVTEPEEAVPADVLLKPENEDGANVVLLDDAPNTEDVVLAAGVEAVEVVVTAGGCAKPAAEMSPKMGLKFWREDLFSNDGAAGEVVAAGKMGLNPAASRGLVVLTDSELLAGGAADVTEVEAVEAEGTLT